MKNNLFKKGFNTIPTKDDKPLAFVKHPPELWEKISRFLSGKSTFTSEFIENETNSK